MNHRHPSTAPVLVFLPAMGVPRQFYAPFLQGLAEGGVHVHALELPGQGDSPLRPGRHDYGYREVVEQMIPAALDEASARWPGHPLFLGGHSLGGQLAVLASHRERRASGLVLLAAGTAHWRRWPRASRLRAAITVHAITLLTLLLPFYPGRWVGFGGNQSRRFMRDWSFNARSGRYRLEGSDWQPHTHGRPLPLLAVSIAGDPLAPPGAVQELLERAPNAQADVLCLPGVDGDAPWKRHFSWARRDVGVARAVADWVSARAAAAPSNTSFIAQRHVTA